MHFLSDILSKTENGQEIVDMAIKLGFKTAKLYNSFSENTICIVVDFELGPEKRSSNANENAHILEYNIAKKFDCKVIVLQNKFMTSDDKVDVIKSSIPLPIIDNSQLIRIFGDPTKFKISTIDEDKRYKLGIETYEIVSAARKMPTKTVSNPTNVTKPLIHSHTKEEQKSSDERGENSTVKSVSISKDSAQKMDFKGR